MAAASPTISTPHVQAVRHFNRFYTRQIGVLQEGLLHSPFSLTEVRVLYELAHGQQATAAKICADLDLDRGYVSRMLRRFETLGLLQKSASERDGRERSLRLTARGEKEFAKLDGRSSEEVAARLGKLSRREQHELVSAMDSIEQLLGGRPTPASNKPYVLRGHQPGDMGWVMHRHGVLYAQEYGWDERFEALVGEITAHFIQNFDCKREHCWIAEKDGEMVGSVFLVKKSKKVAKLRLLLVEPKARGLGIGKRLVEECVRFARQAGYKKITLWTQSTLQAARHIYKQAGFRITGKQPHHSFGYDLVSETWELKL